MRGWLGGVFWESAAILSLWKHSAYPFRAGTIKEPMRLMSTFQLLLHLATKTSPNIPPHTVLPSKPWWVSLTGKFYPHIWFLFCKEEMSWEADGSDKKLAADGPAHGRRLTNKKPLQRTDCAEKGEQLVDAGHLRVVKEQVISILSCGIIYILSHFTIRHELLFTNDSEFFLKDVFILWNQRMWLLVWLLFYLALWSLCLNQTLYS